MTNKEVTQLLEAFYSGTATQEEEQLLKKFFLENENIADEWKADQKCFQAIYSDAEIPLPEGLEERLEKQIHKLAHSSARQTIRKMIYWVGSVAAIALLCVGIFLNDIQAPADNNLADTYTDPMEAAVAAEKALIFMSQQLNKGLEQVSEAKEEFHQINQSVFNQLKD